MKCDEVLNASNPHDLQWIVEARTLMEKRKSFFVVGWDRVYHDQDSTALAQEFDYTLSFPDANADGAGFRPRNSN